MKIFSKLFLLLLLLVTTSIIIGGCSKDDNKTYTLSVNKIGTGGTVNISPFKDQYKKNEVVTLTAQADTDWDFACWEGSGFDGNRNTEITITMTDNIKLNAIFGQITDLIEDFSDNSNNWSEGTSENGNTWQFTADEKYSMTLNNPNYKMWGFPNKFITQNFGAEVEFEFTTENYVEAGFLFNFQDIENYYTFQISIYGNYNISRKYNNNWETVVDWTDASVDETGVIKIAISKNNDKYTFYADDIYLTEIEAKNNIPYLALLVENEDVEPTKVLFDNYKSTYISIPNTTAQTNQINSNIKMESSNTSY